MITSGGTVNTETLLTKQTRKSDPAYKGELRLRAAIARNPV